MNTGLWGTKQRIVAGSIGWSILIGVSSVTRAATWVNGNGTWDNSNTANWNPAAVPGSTTAISLTQSSASDIGITYAATSLTGTELVAGTRYGGFTLSNAGGGTSTLYVSSGDLLPVGSSATIGAGGRLDLSGGTFTPEQSCALLAGGQIVQTGGKHQPRLYDLNMGGGTYDMQGGVASFRQIFVNPSSGTATVSQSGGLLVARQTGGGNNLNFTPAGTGQVVYTLSGGTNDANGSTTTIGANATCNLQGSGFLLTQHINITGGTLNQSGGRGQLMFDVNLTSGTFDFSGGVLTNRAFNIGNTGSGTANATIRGGATQVLTITSTALTVGGGTGSGTLTLNGGTLRSTSTPNMVIGAGGSVIVTNNGALVNMGHLTISGGGRYTQWSSDTRLSYEANVNDGSMTLRGGTLTNRGLNIGTTGGNGTVTISGGTWTYGNNNNGFAIGGNTGRGTLLIKGGGFKGYNGSTGDHGVIGLTGTLRGYANISDTPYCTFSNSGHVIADGDGVDRALDVSGFTGPSGTGAGAVLNPTDNASSNGWFAVSRGKLTWPTRTPAAGTSTINWGEPDSDTTIDLVNSARTTLNSVTALGTMTWTCSLLAPDRTDVPAAPFGRTFISVHQFAKVGFNVASFDLTVRYDDTLVRDDLEPALRLYQYVGSAWSNVPGVSVDTVSKRITATGLTVFGQYAVAAPLPAAGTAIAVR